VPRPALPPAACTTDTEHLELDAGAILREAAPSADAKARAPRSLMQTGTVLVIDDDEMVRELVEQLLAQQGLVVLTAAHGSQDVERFAAHHGPIDLVILDMIMPQMDGAETFRRIREQAPQQAVLLISGFTREEVVSSLVEQGNCRFLRKPFRPDVIIREVAEMLDELPTKSRDEIPERAHVLLVEDHDALRQLTAEALESLGMKVTGAATSKQAVEIFRHGDCSVVVLDLRLPDASGYETAHETAQQMRAITAGASTPIVGLSGSATGNERERCLKAGMDGFLAKPFTIEELHAELESHLSSR
jgi:CheY-like chemotaxis protein